MGRARRASAAVSVDGLVEAAELGRGLICLPLIQTASFEP
jgi:hypothetical protein